jgi:hypothetical protein
VPNVGKIIGGAALLAGAVALDVATGGAAFAAGAEEFTAFLAVIGATGTSLVASGVEGLLATPPPGHGITANNPVQPWQIAYGNVLVPGSFVYLEDNGGILSGGSNTYNKCHNQVIMLTGHPIRSVQQVRLNGKVIPLGAGGSGAQSTTWTYTPSSNQNQTAITSVSRASGVVTLKLANGLANVNGQQLSIQNVIDHSFNGVFTVAQPNPADNTTFTFLSGGADASSSGGYVLTTFPDWKNRIHCDLTSCLGNHTSTFPELLSTSNLWTTAHKNLGKASVYIAYYYDSTVFANGLPSSNFVIEGYNHIYDPRTDSYGYTNNAALVIADYLTNSQWGYGMSYGTDIPLDMLSAAANLCDEDVPLAAGGTEKRYTINYTFNLSKPRGEILQDMLNACAGRISWQSGQFVIAPGGWVGPSLSLSTANLIGPVEYKPIQTITDSYNGVKGTYSSPISNWESTDIPAYAEDALHGFATDRWLAADGGSRLWKDVSFPATTSCPTAQRLAKIDLERLRREGRGTLHCDMSAYPAVALDVISFTHPHWGWTNKTFEVLSSKTVIKSDANGGAPTLGVDLDIAETESEVLDWSLVEELQASDVKSLSTDHSQIVSGPQFLELSSGPTTSYVGNDGIAYPRILVQWVSAPDARVMSGGTIRVEYQKVGDTGWTPLGNIGGDQVGCYISGVVAGEQYSVQVQGFTANGVGSGWAQAGPVTVSATTTSIVASAVKYPDGTPISDLQPAQAGADATLLQPIAHANSNIVPNGTFMFGNINGWYSHDNVASYNASAGGLLLASSSLGALSPSFPVIPGNQYRVTFRCRYTQPGTQAIYHRIAGSGTWATNIDPNAAGNYLHDFLSAGSVAVSLTDYVYDWTCPAGVYFASLGVYETAVAQVVYANVSVQDYAGAGEWGVGNGNGTVGSIVNQGALATLDQTNTADIVAGAVNSNIVYQSTVVINVAVNTITTVAQATITTNGGYVKVRVTMMIFGGSTTSYSYPQIILRKGGSTGTQMVFCGNVFVPLGIVPGGGCSCVTLEAVDDSPATAQQYTVTAYSNSQSLQINPLSLVIENAKV